MQVVDRAVSAGKAVGARLWKHKAMFLQAAVIFAGIILIVWWVNGS